MKSSFKNYRFENLEVWKLGMQIVSETYRLTKKFPKEEIFSLANQLKRAATSIVLNIAEGTGQPTSKGFVLYIQRSKSSNLECVACVKIAIQQKFITEEDADLINKLFQEEYFKLIALRKSIIKNDS